MKLYEIKAQIEKCVKSDLDDDMMIDEETGEVFDKEAFEQLEMDFEEKCLELGRWIKNLDSERAAVYNEKKKLDKREKALSKKIESIKNYLSFVLNGREIKDSNTELKFRKSNSTEIDLKVFMLWENADEYLRYKDPEVNKSEIAKAIKSGKKIPGCEIVENYNLQIK